MTGERMLPRHALLLAGVAALWGFNFVPIRWAIDEVPPFALSSIRFALAAIPMVFFVRRPRVPIGLIAGYGIAIGVGQFGLLFLAIRLGMPAGLASLLMQVQVFFTIALAVPLLRDRWRLAQLAGACIAAVGVGLIAWERIGMGLASTLVGLLLILVAALSWAVGNVIAKHSAREHDPDTFGLVVWSSLASPIPLAAMSYFAEGGTAPIAALLDASAVAWGSILFMAYAATLWGFVQWNRMLHRYSAAAVTPFALLVPIAGLGSAALFLGEPLTLIELAGALVILCGLAVALLWPLKREASSSGPLAASR